MKISFGTDGWRGIISRDVTFDNVETIAQAYADYIINQENGKKGVVIGYDTRFLSREYAHAAACVLAANEIPVFLTAKATATPVVSYSVKYLGLAGGLVVTASHNPALYNGIKIKGWYGGSATPEMTREIAAFIKRNPVKRKPDLSLINLFDADSDYMGHIKKLINWQAIKNSGLRVMIDPMYGAGTGYLRSFLESLGICVKEIHDNFNPGFGNVPPEPVEGNLAELKDAVVAGKYYAGFATDGDADRVGVVDAEGKYINAQEIFALLLWHQLRQGKGSGAVGKTFSTTRMIEKMAAKYRIDVWETPIGFKYLIPLFIQEKIFMGGEESGGIGWKVHLPERDGILNSLLLMEAMSCRERTLGEMIQEIREDIGPHYYQRKDLTLEDSCPDQIINKNKNTLIRELAEGNDYRVEELDGLKIIYTPSRWMLFRASGTEPVIRLYAEAESEKLVKKMLNTAEEIVITLGKHKQ
ncbi:MAG: phosphoglucomutase/phosphomannomutase family protein [Bacillota bacterium]|jgi:phosphomannomutase|nr:phosphoglucomutase/phosphomannomutase family protein [Clostridia bacterium]